MFSRVKTSLLRDFLLNRNGNSAIMFCLAIIPFLGIMGFATDYGLALADKAKLDGAADAAALAAIRVAQSAIQGGGSRTTAMSAGTTLALTAFRANAGSLAFGTAPTPTFTWIAGSSGQTLSFSTTYSMTMTNAFSQLIGYPTTTVKGTAAATLTMPTFINYYIITDISQSMGVGATANDMAALYQRVIDNQNYDNASSKAAQTGCVFGCHVAESYQSVSNEALAHSSAYGTPIMLRIDSAKSAIQAIINDAISSNNKSGQNLIKIGIYTMQQDPQNSGSYIQTISAPPSAPSSVMSAQVTTNMDLGNNNAGGTGDTSFSNSLNNFVSNTLPPQGDGSSASSPVNYVFLITDGLSDVPGSCVDGHCTGPFNDTLCTPLKAKGTVGVIYTTYNPIYVKNDPSKGFEQTYKDLVYNSVGAIPTNLQNCSSDKTQYYFEATDGPGITTAMRALFAPTSQQARISQ